MESSVHPSVDFFLGATTPAGFKGYFAPLRREPGMQLVLLKSGPGCGKSSFMKTIGARRTGERRAHPAHPLRQRPRQSGRGGVPAAETRHHRRHRTPCGGTGSPRRRRAGAEFVPHHRRRCPALPQGRGDRPVCPQPAAAQPGGAVCGLGGQPAAGQPPRRSVQRKL